MNPLSMQVRYINPDGSMQNTQTIPNYYQNQQSQQFQTHYQYYGYFPGQTLNYMYNQYQLPNQQYQHMPYVLPQFQQQNQQQQQQNYMPQYVQNQQFQQQFQQPIQPILNQIQLPNLAIHYQPQNVPNEFIPKKQNQLDLQPEKILGNEEDQPKYSPNQKDRLAQTLICPICLGVMSDPVLTVDGHSYCRQCIIMMWQQQPGKSPVTNLVLQSMVLIPNVALRSVIDQFNDEFPDYFQ